MGLSTSFSQENLLVNAVYWLFSLPFITFSLHEWKFLRLLGPPHIKTSCTSTLSQTLLLEEPILAWVIYQQIRSMIFSWILIRSSFWTRAEEQSDVHYSKFQTDFDLALLWLEMGSSLITTSCQWTDKGQESCDHQCTVRQVFPIFTSLTVLCLWGL